MTRFLVKVGTLSGEIEEMNLSAENKLALQKDLQEKGLHVFWIKRHFGLNRLRNPLKFRERISQTEFTLFNQELAALLRAGLPLLQSLDIMLERMHNILFKSALTEIRNQVKSGTALSEAFRMQGN